MISNPLAIRYLVIISWPVIALLAAPVHADSFRCGHHVISQGDTVEELSRVCGEPKKRVSVRETIQLDGEFRKVRLELWHYQLDERRLSREVMVHEGEVVGVRTGSR